MKTKQLFSKIIVFVMILLSCPVAFSTEISATIIPTGTTANFFGVWGFDANNVYAVGDNGIISKYNGYNAVIIPNTSTATLKGVSGCSISEVWAAGTAGTAVKINSTSTTVYNVGTAVDLKCVKVLAPNDVWVGGTDGIIARWNGSSWAIVSNSYPNFAFVQIFGNSPSNMYFVGKDIYAPYTSRILNYNGSVFTEIVNDPSGRRWARVSTFDDNLFYLFCLKGTYSFTKSTGVITEIYPGGSLGNYEFDANSGVICGGDSGVVKYDGVNWTVLRNLPPSNVVFAPQNSGSKVFFAGQGGIFYFSDFSVGISPEEPVAPSKFNVYPNPTSNQFNIDLKFDENVNANIQLFNLLGQQVKETYKFEGNEFNRNIDVSTLKPGTYLVMVCTNKGGKYYEKVVVTK